MKLNVSKEWCENMAKLEGDAEIGAGMCIYCKGEPEWVGRGWIEMPNNGPIASCPICNNNGAIPRPSN